MNQADVALLDQISQFKTVIPVFMGNLDHKAQVGDDQLFRGLHVIVFLELHGEFEFFFGRQERKAVDLGNINVKSACNDR